MHLYVDIGDASSSLWGSTSSFFFFKRLYMIHFFFQEIVFHSFFFQEIVAIWFIFFFQEIVFDSFFFSRDCIWFIFFSRDCIWFFFFSRDCIWFFFFFKRLYLIHFWTLYISLCVCIFSAFRFVSLWFSYFINSCEFISVCRGCFTLSPYQLGTYSYKMLHE